MGIHNHEKSENINMKQSDIPVVVIKKFKMTTRKWKKFLKEFDNLINKYESKKGKTDYTWEIQ